MNKKLKSINIKGKQYVEVHEKIKYFRATYPNYSLTSKVIEKTESSILIQATIKDDKKRKLATGTAEEIKGSTFINKTSYVENCETSAWGRALSNLGIGVDTSVASADEVSNAIANQNKPAPVKKGVYTLKVGDDKWEKVLKFVVDNKTKGLSWIIEKLETKFVITKDVHTKLKNHAS